MKMAERALAAMKQDADSFRTWSRTELREAAGVSIRAAYRLFEEVSDSPEVEYSVDWRLKLREDIAAEIHNRRQA